MKLLVHGACWLVFSATVSSGFNGHRVSEGPLTLSISPISTVTNLHRPEPVGVSLANSGAQTVVAQLELTGLLDECKVVGPRQYSVGVPSGGETNVVFHISMEQGSLSALYPVHVIASVGSAWPQLHAIRIFESDLPAGPQGAEPAVPRLAAGGSLSLATVRSCRIRWNRFGQATEYQPLGWRGTDPGSGTTFALGPVTRGQTRQALQLHPPYRGGAGTVFTEYRMRLPELTPIQIRFYNAIRDHSENEPPSDGVTFRVWADDTTVFERHTDSKSWVAGEADLSAWAGKEILLRLETHPGSEQNTVCDSGFWGDPVLMSGPSPARLSVSEKAELASRAREALRSGGGGSNVFVFELEQETRAALVLGPNGLVDGILAFGNEKAVLFEGFNIAVADQVLDPGSIGVPVTKVEQDPKGIVTILQSRGESLSPLKAQVWKEGPALKVRISCADRIDSLSIGPADLKAVRVYYGHGYCLVEPEKFRAGGGGHNLSTSHVGFDFESGVSLLMACDTPPDFFQVDPAERIYALHTHPDTTFAFVPGTKGAFDCAVRYRPVYDKKPAPAVGNKAGRFVFDIWGGRYAEDAERLRRCFDYGLTNSLAIMHVWQRWGYDYRLPDIFPPQPGLGSLEDLQAVGKACDEVGALWGLHDNYIDIYPDATGFSYDHVTFDGDGRPRKAWLNEGRNAQSYQFRPDHVRPFLERNLRLIAPALRPSSSFVDVWTSINAFDYHDRQGQFHSKMETLRGWGEAFALIREACGGGPATSEAGSDQLIGWLEGADCQFLELGEGKRFHNYAPCMDWERVPWFDAVNHARFSLHGVGYSDRYQGGRSRALHGIESDDYISAEILTGHALMIDLPGMVRGAVRKYWLAQPFIESICLDDIAVAEFVGGDIHRLHVRWNSGAEVYVNRAANDWTVAGHTLPHYGYFARNGGVESAIERINGAVVERSSSPGISYVNGRGYDPDAPLFIQPVADRVEYGGGRTFSLLVNWRAESPAPKDLSVFYHFSRPTPGRYMNTEFVGGGKPTPGTAKWSGVVRTGTNWLIHIPEGMPLGEYDVLVGLYDADGKGQRYRLLGEETNGRRYRVGTLFVEGAVTDGKTNISALDFRKAPEPSIIGARTINRQPTDFGAVKTTGAVRICAEPKALLVIPLPDGEDFEISARLERLAGAARQAKSLYVVDARGRRLEPAKLDAGPDGVSFRVAKGAFAYRLELTP